MITFDYEKLIDAVRPVGGDWEAIRKAAGLSEANGRRMAAHIQAHKGLRDHNAVLLADAIALLVGHQVLLVDLRWEAPANAGG